MSRIRTVKPEFFRHELLQSLEQVNPGCYPMLVFEGLWTLCDKAGRFEWRPKQIKLDVLPFLDFDMEHTLDVLWEAGLLAVYEIEGKRYGLIESILDHQRFSGSEAKSDPKFPAPQGLIAWEALRKHSGSIEEVTRKHQRCPVTANNDDQCQKRDTTSTKDVGSTLEAPWKHLGTLEGKGNGVWSTEEGKGMEFSSAPPSSTPVAERKVKSEAKYPNYPTTVCDQLFAAYQQHRGPVEYGLFRRSTQIIFPTGYTVEQLTSAIQAWGEWVAALPADKAKHETARTWAADVQRWVRLGALPCVDLNGVTERGLMAVGGH